MLIPLGSWRWGSTDSSTSVKYGPCDEAATSELPSGKFIYFAGILWREVSGGEETGSVPTQVAATLSPGLRHHSSRASSGARGRGYAAPIRSPFTQKSTSRQLGPSRLNGTQVELSNFLLQSAQLSNHLERCSE